MTSIQSARKAGSDGLLEVGGGNHERVAVLLTQEIDAGQKRIYRAVHVHGIGLEAQAIATRGQVSTSSRRTTHGFWRRTPE
jgi:hypothetical protein